MDFNNDGKISFWEMFPYWFDKLRVFPRVFITVYIIMFWRVTEWFMALAEPNNAQAGLVSVVVGAGAAWFGLYCNSSKNNSTPPKTSKRKVLKEEYKIPLNVRRRLHILRNILGSSLRSSYPCDYDVLDEFIEDIISDVNQFFRWIDKEDGMTSEQAELTIRDYLLDNIKEYYLEEIQNC